ncbi:MFS transporter [Kribbella solani]|uniref:MFS transporter n=1 Tax=Kribbella solani TaxID=236067 RepID=UPI0029AC3AC9|nr:MFS transporter [Kribbella solani]MDX2970025.1 MFS transporter [Kribbella solani]MDX3001891.1 MFS transporter [Kribbella solani]
MSEEADRDPAPAERPGAGLGPIAIWRQTSLTSKALLFGVFVNRLGAFLQIFLVLFMTHKGFTAGQAGFALGVYGAGHVLGTFVGGWLTDRLSARAATLISMLGSGVLIVSILYIRPYWLILVAILVVSTVSMLNRPAAQAMLAELTKPGQLVMTMAMYRLAINLGTAVTPILGVALVSVSYDLLFWAEAFAAVLYSAIAWKFLPGKPTAEEAAAKAAARAAEKRHGYRAVLADWRYDFYLAAVFLVTVVYCQYLAVLPLAIVDDGLSLWWYSLVVSANAIVVAVCEVPATKYVQTWPLRITAIAGFGLVAVGYGVYAIALIPALLIVGTIIWTASEIIGAPTTFAYPGMVAPPHLMGRYSGAMLTVFGLGNAVGPAVGVWAWSKLGQSFWLWAAAVAVLSAVCARIGMRRPDAEPAKVPAPTPATDPSTEPAA